MCFARYDNVHFTWVRVRLIVKPFFVCFFCFVCFCLSLFQSGVNLLAKLCCSGRPNILRLLTLLVFVYKPCVNREFARDVMKIDRHHVRHLGNILARTTIVLYSGWQFIVLQFKQPLLMSCGPTPEEHDTDSIIGSQWWQQMPHSYIKFYSSGKNLRGSASGNHPQSLDKY